jgi:hypothetical protein
MSPGLKGFQRREAGGQTWLRLWRSNTRANETGGIVFYDIHADPRDVRDSTEVLAAIMSRIVITVTIDESNGTPRADTVTRTDVVAWPD